MTMSAIVMMVVAIVALWGGLAAAAYNLFSRDDLSAGDEVPPST